MFTFCLQINTAGERRCFLSVVKILNVAVAAFAEEGKKGQKYDLQIKEERHSLGIFRVKFESLFPRKRVAALDLCKSRQPGADGVAEIFLIGITRQKFRKLRARTDEGHLSAKDVHKLRKLVDARPPQESAKARQPFRVGQELALRVALIRHCSEFKYHKFPPAETTARLAEYHGRPELQPYE